MPHPRAVILLPSPRTDSHAFLHRFQQILDTPLWLYLYASRSMTASLLFPPMSPLPSDGYMLRSSSMDNPKGSLPVLLSLDLNEYNGLAQSNICPCLQ